MKTTKFITTLSALTFIIFMSVTAIANSTTSGDGEKSSATRISVLKDMIADAAASTNTVNEFEYLRFDVARYTSENAEAGITRDLETELRFDVNKYMNTETSSAELPLAVEFSYLRFDASAYSNAATSEMPARELDYLRFDVNSFAAQNPVPADEMPEVR